MSSLALRIGLVATLLAAGCSGAIPSDAERATGVPTPTATPRQERPASAQPRLRVSNEAQGPSRARMTRAIADLKAVGLWRRLTRGLYSLQLQSDPGAEGLPEDGHLADAMLSAVVESGGAGSHCSVRFYPAAMKAEIATLERGYASGVLGPPPSLRQLWGTILAHELAHCRNWEGGEPFAERWEERALEAFRGAGIE